MELQPADREVGQHRQQRRRDGAGQHHRQVVQGDAGEDQLAQAAGADQEGQRRGADADRQGGPDAAEDDEQRVRQLDPPEHLARGHAHAPRRLDQRRRHVAQPGIGVADDRQQRRRPQAEHRRHRADAEHRHAQRQHRQCRDRGAQVEHLQDQLGRPAEGGAGQRSTCRHAGQDGQPAGPRHQLDMLDAEEDDVLLIGQDLGRHVARQSPQRRRRGQQQPQQRGDSRDGEGTPRRQRLPAGQRRGPSGPGLADIAHADAPRADRPRMMPA
jgi:hypothetical protein